MMFLHSDKELFRDVIMAASVDQKRPVAIIEKDYYVTMILKLLAQAEPGCVFKGGTSLSKCHHIIDRLSIFVEREYGYYSGIWAGTI